MNFIKHCDIASLPFAATQAGGYAEVEGGHGPGNRNGPADSPTPQGSHCSVFLVEDAQA